MGRLEGKSVIITGAGSGIGRAASLLFTKEGAKLIAVDRTEASRKPSKQVRKAGGTAEAVMADAGSEKDVMAFIDKAVSAYGRLDAIWANAGISGGLVPLAEQTVEHWQEILRVNLIGPFLAIKYSMPQMIKQGYGSIVCTASVAGLKSGASGHPYACEQGRRDQPGADHGLFAVRHRRAHQRGVPRPDRDRHDQADFDRASERGTDDKIGQLNPLKRAGQPHETRRDGTVPRQRRGVLRQRPGYPGRRRPHRLDAVCGQADLGFLAAASMRSWPRTHSREVNALLKAELAITLSHRHNTLAGVALVS